MKLDRFMIDDNRIKKIYRRLVMKLVRFIEE